MHKHRPCTVAGRVSLAARRAGVHVQPCGRADAGVLLPLVCADSGLRAWGTLTPSVCQALCGAGTGSSRQTRVPCPLLMGQRPVDRLLDRQGQPPGEGHPDASILGPAE